MTLPNFLIIGAAKSGTTALWYILKQHPEIFMSSPKEARFFSYENMDLNFKGPGDDIYNQKTITNLENYKLLFKEATNELAVGEASPIYLTYEETARKIKTLIPDVKLIVSLRNPAERAFSNYRQKRREGFETEKNFAGALKLEKKRKDDNYAPTWFYIERGFYYNALKEYFDIFNKDQIRVYLYEELNKDTPRIIKDIFYFLEVDERFIPDTKTRINESFIPKSRLLFSLLKYRWKFYRHSKRILPKKTNRKIISYFNHMWEKNKLKPEITESDRRELINIYREDILKTQDLIDKDLSTWLR